MSHHNKPEYNTPAIVEGLKLHGLAVTTPSQLSDAFRFGYVYAASGYVYAASEVIGKQVEIKGEYDVTLKTIQQHNDEVAAVRKKAELSGIACPSCDENLRWTQTTTFSMPPRRGVSCECGWSGQVN